MRSTRSPLSPWVAAVTVGVAVGLAVPHAQAPQGPLPLEPNRERGTSVTPAYEGWFTNPDGTFTMLLGYMNRNSKQTFDIPVGPNNKIEPGLPDQGQPTHFETGRQWGVVGVRVPKDFGTKKVTWTIVANGEAQAIPFGLNNPYNIAPMKEIGMGNEPPIFAFAQGQKAQGPPSGFSASYTGAVNAPVAVTLVVNDPKGLGQEAAAGAAPAAGPAARRGPASVATVSFHKYRGPGTVTFDKARIPVLTQGDTATANATFSAPGEYWLRVQGNDESGEGGGGFQCCWTNAYVKVTIQ